MKVKCKYIMLIGIIIASLFMFMGCSNVKVRTDTKINMDGTSQTLLKIYYDDSVKKLINGELIEGIVSNIGEDILGHVSLGEVKTYNDGDFNVEEVEINTKKVDLKEIEGNNYIDVKVNESKGMVFNTYKVTIKLKNGIFDILSDNLNNYLNEYINFNLNNLINKSLDSTIGSVPYDLEITIPMEIVDTNATDRIDEHTVLYSYTLSDLNKENEMILSFKMINVVNVIIMIFLAIILVVFIIIGVKKKK